VKTVFWAAALVSFASCRTLSSIYMFEADELPNDYQSLLVVVVVVVVMAAMSNDYHMVVVVAAVMVIWLRKSAGCKEHEQNKC
jgi:hypothetical protein